MFLSSLFSWPVDLVGWLCLRHCLLWRYEVLWGVLATLIDGVIGLIMRGVFELPLNLA